AFRGRLMSLLAPARGMPTLPAKGGFSRPSSIRSAGSHRGLSSHRSLAYHARILKVFSYLYMVKFEILSRLLLSVQAFAFRGRLMSLLELTHCGVSSRPFIPQESHACTSSNKWKYSKQLTSLMLNAFVQL